MDKPRRKNHAVAGLDNVAVLVLLAGGEICFFIFKKLNRFRKGDDLHFNHVVGKKRRNNVGIPKPYGYKTLAVVSVPENDIPFKRMRAFVRNVACYRHFPNAVAADVRFHRSKIKLLLLFVNIRNDFKFGVADGRIKIERAVTAYYPRRVEHLPDKARKTSLFVEKEVEVNVSEMIKHNNTS